MSQYENNYYQNGGAGGGGFLTGGSPGSANGSPGGMGRKNEAQHSLRPVTVGQLRKATQAHTDAEWMIENDEIGQVTVVAQVMSIQVQTTNTVYWLDDGSGRIEARHWMDSSNPEDVEKWGGIVENTYVRVTGNLKTFGNKRYINAQHIRPSTNPHELYFHLGEAMVTNLMIERGMPPGPGQTAQQNGVVASGSGASAYTTQSRAQTSQFAGLPPLQRSIMEFLHSQPPNDEGVHVGAIARSVQGGDAAQISSALDALMDDGHVYTTLDDSHFQIST
ncbi:hypothetical protein PILCRDRAFT_815629 [Piloderma croceum F 1598]|uniref:Replication protein A C-terminal domain-containing protein n=1 Tax=Piloderma croceum (strain F 1598) TaxID=765440 RepID=A0A0C3BL59_PILCF|nr:hypothetical protein PILCRDRAFT_815629 [Piloderma croceum F 1598]